jgi:hypothetical protein
MLDAALVDDIIGAVDAGFTDQVKLTQDLVRYPSLRGQEHTAQDFLYDQMARRGLTTDRWAIDVDAIKHHPGFSPVAVDYRNAFNVVGTHRPRETRGKSLILNGHVDVVPLGPLDMWERPPLVGELSGGRMHGSDVLAKSATSGHLVGRMVRSSRVRRYVGRESAATKPAMRVPEVCWQCVPRASSFPSP